MIVGADVDEALLALKIAFLVLLYLFIWVIVRSATRDIRVAPQESIVLSPSEAQTLREASAGRAARLRVMRSETLTPGGTVTISGVTGVGRGGENGLRLDDDFVSSRHARFDLRDDSLWIEDAGSRNGTFVNDARVTTARQLREGDVVRIGQTELEVVA